MVYLYDGSKLPDSYCIKHDNYFRLGYTCVYCVMRKEFGFWKRLEIKIGQKWFEYGHKVRPSSRYGEFKKTKEDEGETV